MIHKIFKHRLDLLFGMMCLMNYVSILFFAIVMYVSINRIVDMQQARMFLSKIDRLPSDRLDALWIALISYGLILALIYCRKEYVKKVSTQMMCFVVETLLAMIILWTIAFGSNAIILLVMADLLSETIDKRPYRIVFMVFLFALYLFSGQDVVSSYLPFTKFVDYIVGYDGLTRSFLLGISGFLSGIHNVLFLLFCFFLIQDKIEENRRFIALNEELKAVNEQLKDYADIREKMGETKERNRLAREIHDTLGHTLTGLSVGLDACVLMCSKDTETTKKQLILLSEMTRQGLKDVRRSVEKLKPDALERYTLQEAIHIMIKEFEDMTDVKIDYLCHIPKLNLESDEEEVVYRIIQEGMTNAVRHGHATHICISIGLVGHELILLLEDNGTGCDVVHPGFGLHHMQERVELLHGKLRYYNVDGFMIAATIMIRGGMNG